MFLFNFFNFYVRSYFLFLWKIPVSNGINLITYMLGLMQIMHYLNGHNYSYYLQSTPLTLTLDAFIAKTHDPSIFCCFSFWCCFYFLSYFSAHPVKVLDFQLWASAKLFIFIYFQNDDVDTTLFPGTLIPEYA